MTPRDHCPDKLLLLLGLWACTLAEVSRCRSCCCFFLAWCLMVSRHPQHVSLALIDWSAKLVEPLLRFGFHACGCHKREARWRRCPTGTAHDTLVCETLCKGFAMSSCPLVVVVLLAVLIVHSCSDLLAVLIVQMCSHPSPWTCGCRRCPHRRQVHITNASYCFT